MFTPCRLWYAREAANRRLFEPRLARAGDVLLPPSALPLKRQLSEHLNQLVSDSSPIEDAVRDLEDYVRANRLMASPMRFGAFLTEHFEADIVESRRARERASGDEGEKKYSFHRATP